MSVISDTLFPGHFFPFSFESQSQREGGERKKQMALQEMGFQAELRHLKNVSLHILCTCESIASFRVCQSASKGWCKRRNHSRRINIILVRQLHALSF